MFLPGVRTGSILVGAALLAAAFLFGDRVEPSMRILTASDENEILDAVVSDIPADQFSAEMRLALDAKEPDTALSILELARSHNIAVPASLATEIAAAQGLNRDAIKQDLWQCVSAGTVESDIGLACVVATDMTAIGDVRDLAVEGARMSRGEPYDEVVLAMSVIGLGVSAATVTTAGMAVPVRVGLSFLKAAKKAGKLPPALAHELKVSLADAIDTAAVRRAAELAGQLRLTELRQTLPTIIRPAAFRKISRVAEDIGTVYSTGGVRALNRSLQLAQNSTTLAKLGERARHLKKGFPGALKMLGAGIVAVSTFVTAATLWIAGALTWIALVILVLFRPIWAIFRVLRGLAFARRPA